MVTLYVILLVLFVLWLVVHVHSLPGRSRGQYTESAKIIWPVRYFNFLCGLWSKMIGKPLFKIDTEKLIKAAFSRSKPNNTEPRDLGAHFLAGCEKMAASLNDEDLTPFAYYYFNEEFTARITRRIELLDYLAGCQDVPLNPVCRPLIIVSLPRTGTTFLHQLLCQNAQSRYLNLWVQAKPLPPPTPEQFLSNPRIRQVEKVFKFYHWLLPEMRAIHMINATFPEEEAVDFMHNFFDEITTSTGYFHDYLDWQIQTDKRPFYRDFHMLLKILDTAYPPPRKYWSLKWPTHTAWISELLEEFPDANIVQVHRNPAETVPSMASLCRVNCRMLLSHIDLEKIGRVNLDYWKFAVGRLMDYRKSMNPEVEKRQFYDVYFEDLKADPIGTAQKICSHFDYPVAPDFEQQMRLYLQDNPPGKFGKHNYSPERFNLTAEKINREFAEYIEHFDLPA